MSIALDPSFQGIGVGRIALSIALWETHRHEPSIWRWKAVVRSENQSSLNMFMAAGFAFEEEREHSHGQFLTMVLVRT